MSSVPRRRLLCAASALLAMAFGKAVAQTQQRPKLARIGVLTPGSIDRLTQYPARATFEGLRALGYVEGSNVAIERRAADGDVQKLPLLAKELLDLKPDVMIAIGTIAAKAIQSVTTTVPVVVATATDPVGSGLVKSLSRPGTNITGLSNMAMDINTKVLELLLAVAPGVRRVGIFMSSNQSHRAQLDDIRRISARLGIEAIAAVSKTWGDIDATFAEIRTNQCDALIVLADARVERKIIDFAATARIPTIYYLGEFVNLGGLMSYGPDFVHLHSRAATYVDRILKGERPQDIPVEQPTKFELAINLKTAKQLGFKIPQSVLVRADRVIE